MAMMIVMALSWLCGKAEPQASPVLVDSVAVSGKEYTVSLITCYPGPEIYELCGHEAIRVRGEGIDSVWNFGIFDFAQPNFVYRFVKGETDYKCAAYPFAWFLPEYRARGSRVVEQDLNLTPEESRRLVDILRAAAQPENATYRYNYLKDNCATRIIDKVGDSSSVEIIWPDSVRYGTFRNEMRAYHKGYPWYQFGIDIALGSGLDEKIGSKEEMFVPVEMMRNVSSAKFADGRPLVKATRVLNEGVPDSVEPPTPWFTGPVFIAWLVSLISLLVVAANVVKGRLTKPYYAAWFSILGTAGILVAFLVFISVHEATSPNVLILWLNPFQFLFVAGILIRRLRILSIVMGWYNLAVGLGLLIASPFITQSFNSAFYPLLLSTASLGGAYAIIINKSSYKNI